MTMNTSPLANARSPARSLSAVSSARTRSFFAVVCVTDVDDDDADADDDGVNVALLADVADAVPSVECLRGDVLC